jgi:two-component system cell cycle response regulator
MVGDREKVLAAGFQGYIPKPIVPETFVAQLEGFIPAGLRAGVPPGPPLVTHPEARSAAPCRTSPHAGARVLVVDDAEPNLSLMCSMLGPFGYRVVTARGVGAALAELARDVPDLIVSDVHMADGTGYDLIATIRSDPRLRDVPFVFLSSTATSREEEARAMSLGARRFVSRPLEPRAVLATVEECLAASGAADGNDPSH